MHLDETDKKLIDLLQRKFPLVSRPFRHMAVTLVIEETEVIERVKKLKEAGLVRRIGPLFNSKKLGYKSMLMALKTVSENEAKVVKYLNGFDQITHNYKRNNEFNIWFTFTYKEDDELDDLLGTLKSDYSVHDIIKLPSIKTYKLKTEFKVE